MSGFRPASSLLRLEIELPSRPPARLAGAAPGASHGTTGTANETAAAAPLASDSIKALRKSKYSLNTKRKRTVVEDSDLDEEDFEESDDDALQDQMARDFHLARQLQMQEDKKQPAPLPEIVQNRRVTRGLASLDAKPAIVLSDDSASEVQVLASRPVKRLRTTTTAGPSAQPKAELKTPKTEPMLIPDNAVALTIDDSDSELSVLSGRVELSVSSGSVSDAFEAGSDADSYMSNGEAQAVLNEQGGQASRGRLGTRRQYRQYKSRKRAKNDRERLEDMHPILRTIWTQLESKDVLKAGMADQPETISRNLKPFQREGLAWMMAMEKTPWKGGLLGDEMGLGKTIQAVSLIMSDYPAKKPTLVLVPPVALMQWMSEIASYTNGCLKTLVFHSTNSKTKGMTVKDLKKYDVILMSYNSLESFYRKQEKGFKRKEGIYKEESVIHLSKFHRVLLDEAHCIKVRRWLSLFSFTFAYISSLTCRRREAQ